MGRRILAPFVILLALAVGCEQESPSEPETPKGALAITVEGLPDGVDGSISVQGPGGYQTLVTETQTLTGLFQGNYTLTAGTVSGVAATYTAFPAQRTEAVTAGQTTSVTVTYGESTADNNVWIEGMYIAQVVQTFDGTVPLIADREGLLRVFVRATKVQAVAPPVRVSLYDGAQLTETIDIPAPGSSVSSSLDEADLDSSWNLTLTPAQITPGLRILVEVDPDNTFEETDETDNRFPTSGTPEILTVMDVGVMQMRFVPIFQQSNGLTGDVDTGNMDDFMAPVQQMMPIPSYASDVRSTYTTTLPPLQNQDQNGSWGALLNELSTLRSAEETVSARHWYGVVDCDYGAGVAGIAYVGGKTGFGRQLDSPVFEEIMPHELGHNLNRQHSACGTQGQHQDYPHPNGQIGAYGFDLPTQTLFAPTTPDVMGYCSNVWISDYTFENAAAYRLSVGKTGTAGRRVPCLLVWGRIDGADVILEPAFQVEATPREPSGAGPHQLRIHDPDGAVAYEASFTGTRVADLPRGPQTHFTFLIPMDAAAGSLQVVSPHGEARRTRPAIAPKSSTPALRAVAGGVELEWDAVATPMIMVRDAASGEILSLARGGAARLKTAARDLELRSSHGVGSTTQRVTVR